MSNKYNSVKVETLLIDNNVRAELVTYWDKESNRNCKFLPGQKARVKMNASIAGRARRQLRGVTGTVIAASSPNGFNLTTDSYVRRGHTNYYVAFRNGVVKSFESYQLV